MNTASEVNRLFAAWSGQGLPKHELIVKTAEAEIGWPYVWGATGQKCTPAQRRAYAARSSCPAAEAEVTLKKCPVCNGSATSCDGCKYYPGNCTLIDDCQGFVKQISARIGIHYEGGGATSMWNSKKNWSAKGTIDSLPKDKVCCVFWQSSDKKKMSHIGFYEGNGYIVHCSGEVKKEKLPKRVTHWAMPLGLYEGDTPMKPTIRRGSTGPYVVECQTDLIKLGYDVGSSGADGKFGAKTQAAVKAFQRDYNKAHPEKVALAVDGVVGPATWTALDEAVGNLPAPTPTPTPEPAVLYTVTIPHLTEAEADALVKQYTGAEKKAEGR